MNDDLSRKGVLVHEWLEPTGGSENVFEVMASVFPETPIVTPWNNAPGRFSPARVRETSLAQTPLRHSKPAAALALPFVWRSKALAASAEWALISSHLFAHHLRVAPDATKLVYVHTPARYIWSPELDPRGAALSARAAAAPLKWIDRKRAREASSIAANSRFVRDRVRRHWQRDAEVIYPPVAVLDVRRSADEEAWQHAADGDVVAGLPEEFLLGVSRFVSYKRLDLVIEAGVATGLPVVIAGGGPEEDAIRSLADGASVDVRIVQRPSSAVLHALYKRATALVFPAVEDFGIVPVEAMAVGTPVIGVGAGGLLETVSHEETGYLLEEFDREGLQRAVRAVRELPRDVISASADRFSDAAFRSALGGWVDSIVPQASATRA
ncbi:glycosyltransferase [Amnibacterium soli]